MIVTPAAAGLAVAGVYYAQPLLDLFAADLGIAPADVGIVFAVSQLGYGVALLMLVPFGDMLDRRRLIVAYMSLCAAALGAVAVSPTRPLLLAALAAVGAHRRGGADAGGPRHKPEQRGIAWRRRRRLSRIKPATAPRSA